MEELLKGADTIFRKEIQDEPTIGFDREAQLKISAQCLTNLRDIWAIEWERVHHTIHLPVRSRPEHRGVREFRKRIANEIRVADESVDCLATVAFVSKAVLQCIGKDHGAKLGKSNLGHKNFTHEHGVPVDVITRIIVHPDNKVCELFPVLDALSCRALLTKKEALDIDEKFRSSLPITLSPTRNLCVGLKTLPLRFYALARYYAVDSRLVEKGLVPTNSRSKALLDDFLELVHVGPSLAAIKRVACESSIRQLCYVPDTVFCGKQRKPIVRRATTNDSNRSTM